ncbi:lytic polysaccharide monooxygenase auxiliary activity family 9 protein [Streptomyces sp. 6N223]|uniref:lytic polysaccharide monooxygenase auxiliary activity family 9 protein n=1 Tax=Streptomyces sp. 6N223 TaxID=3457412 RepID=UPI003FD3F2CC
MSDRARLRARAKRLGLLTALATLPAMAGVMFTAGSASAHGAPLVPGSRTYLCYAHSLDETGALNPTNPACKAAMETSGANGFYNWFAVLRSDGGGRTEGFVPDGELCSGGATVYDFSGFDLPREDWPVTHLTAGETYEVQYNNWAHHPGSIRMYITNDSYDPTQPLTWDNLEDVPFDEATDPPAEGGPGTDEGHYYWDATMPSDVSGRHIIYMVWERSDSEETFYSCSDVVFDGGDGEVTVPGQGTLTADELADAAAAVEENTPAVDHATDHATSADHATAAEHAAHAGPAAPTASTAVFDAVRTALPGWLR